MAAFVPSSSAEVIANPARFLDEIRAGHIVYLSDLGGTVTLAEADEETADMVSLRSERTGVDNTIFVSTKDGLIRDQNTKTSVFPVQAIREDRSGCGVS